jgi:hypothetical protein
MNERLVLAVCAGLIYLAIWGMYRFVRWREYRRLHNTHRKERLRRAGAESRQRGELSSEELIMRGQWEAEHGPLMGPLDLKRREEEPWSVGAALQGAAIVTTGLAIATTIGAARCSTELVSPSQCVPSSNSSSLALWKAPEELAFGLTVIALLTSGIAIWRLSESRAAKAIGGALLLSAPLLSGMKLFTIERFVVEKLISLEIGSRPPPPPVNSPKLERPKPFSFTLTLPPFESGSAEPGNRLRCSLHTLARDLAEDTSIASIVVMGRADRRELRPAARRKYATNWSLAQQRGACVQEVLTKRNVSPAKIMVTTAGPVHISWDPKAVLDQDRAVSIFIHADGDTHPWVSRVSKSGEWSYCDENAMLSPDPCVRQ